jgi:hypothetical protein
MKMSDRPRERRKFHYTPPTLDQVRKVVENKRTYPSIFNSDAKIFKAKEGNNLVRILPPTWDRDNPTHYGYAVYSHNGVGPGNGSTYLCPLDNETSPYNSCPVCDELNNLGRRATKEEYSKLKSKRAILYAIIDRNNKEEGIQIWRASSTTDSEIAAQAIDEFDKSLLRIEDPYEGYDIQFHRIGTGFNDTEYKGFKIARRSSPLSDNEKELDRWLEWIEDHSIPSLLNFTKPEDIEKAMHGRTPADEDEDNDAPVRVRDRVFQPQEREPLRRTRAVEKEEEPEEVAKNFRTADKDEDPQPSRRRSRLGMELDDEIPSDGGRRAEPNGRDEENEEVSKREASRAPASNLKEPEPEEEEEEEEEDEEPTPPRRRRRSLDDDGDTIAKAKDEAPRSRRAASEKQEEAEPEVESREDRNARVRERLRATREAVNRG